MTSNKSSSSSISSRSTSCSWPCSSDLRSSQTEKNQTNFVSCCNAMCLCVEFEVEVRSRGRAYLNPCIFDSLKEGESWLVGWSKLERWIWIGKREGVIYRAGLRISINQFNSCMESASAWYSAHQCMLHDVTAIFVSAQRCTKRIEISSSNLVK